MAESQEEINDSPIEQVRLTVPPTDDTTLPVMTIRTWVLGLTACIFLAFTKQFFTFRQNVVFISSICIDIVVLAGGKLMANLLPAKLVRVPLTGWSFSLNPGPFNIKEHVLVSIFANAGNDYPQGISIITLMKVFYKRSLQPLPAFLLVLSTMLLGYGFAGIYMKFLVYSPYMWWPETLVNVSFYRALHEPEERQKGGLTRFQFFIIVTVSSFAYYLVPSYFFPSITALSFICWIWKDSVTAQQIGSGFNGLGVGSFALDWMTISSYFGNPLATPVFNIFNVMAGLILALYVVTPISYWTNAYNAKRFPILSSNVFDADGQIYNISRILDEKTLKFNEEAYNNYSKLYFSSYFPYHYGFNFACLTASVSHTILFHGKSFWNQFKQAYHKQDEDIHTKLMKQNYEPVPQWWFYVIFISMISLGIFACEGFGKQLQLSYWGILLACIVVLILLLPNGIIRATSGSEIPINVLLEMIMGYVSPGKPIANVTFRVYGLMSFVMASSFISDFKLGLYMKIPPKLMFLFQVLGSVVSCIINFGMAWWLLSSVKNICHPELLPEGSPWTCPYERLEYNLGITWGVVGPHRMFYPNGTYSGIFIFFIIGFLAPIPVWILSRIYPNKKWVKLINFPIMFAAATWIPPATAVNFWSWLVVSILFNVVVFRKYKGWWRKYNYLLSAGLDTGIAFMIVVASISLNLHDIFGVNWWGLSLDDHCPLAKCPTTPDIVVEGCPIIR